MTGNMTPLNIAVIGAGGMGARWARSISTMPEVRIVSVCDSNLEKATKVALNYPDCRSVSSWGEVAEDPQIDAVVVVLPHNLLAKASCDFLRAGKHVLSEKPGGIEPKEIERAIDIASENGLRYMIGFDHRFHDAFLQMRSKFEEGVIGEPLFIRARYGFGGRLGYEREWRLDPSISGGGELIDQGVHMIDLARVFLGEFVEVNGFIQHAFWKAPGEDNAFVLLKNQAGNIANIHVSLTNWKPEHLFELYGTKGYLIVEGLGKKYGGKELLKIGIRDTSFVQLPQEEIIECDNDADNALRYTMRTFVQGIQTGFDSRPSGHDALAVLKIVQQVYHQNHHA